MTDASGLVYLRARYYLPELGVFPSLDPVEGALDHPPSLNRYGYAQQNPVNWTDPSGQCTDPITCAILFALGLAVLAGCSAENCGSEPPQSILSSIVQFSIQSGEPISTPQGTAYPSDLGLGTFIGGYKGRKNCFLTHGHYRATETTYVPSYIRIRSNGGADLYEGVPPSNFVVEPGTSFGQSVLCFDDLLQFQQMSPIAMDLDPENTVKDCKNVFWVHNLGRDKSDHRSVELIIKSVEVSTVESGVLLFKTVDEAPVGDSGGPFLINGNIVATLSTGRTAALIIRSIANK